MDASNALNSIYINVSSDGQEILFHCPLRKTMGEKKKKKINKSIPFSRKAEGLGFHKLSLRSTPIPTADCCLASGLKLLVR